MFMVYKWMYSTVHMYTCTGVYMVCVYTCYDLEKAYMIMRIGTIRGLEVESPWGLGATLGYSKSDIMQAQERKLQKRGT